MADGGGGVVKNDESDKSAGGKSEPTRTVVRKPSRRSPTTGHRRKKVDVKRSQSSPREITAPTSSDDDGQQTLSRRKSLSPGPGPEPKKVLRRRHKIKEKSNSETTDQASSPPDSQKLAKNEVKEPIVDEKDSKPRQNGSPKRTNSNEPDPIDHSNDDTPKLQEQRDDDETLNHPTAETHQQQTVGENIQPETNQNENLTPKPNTWWAGWSPFKRKLNTNSDVTSDEQELLRSDDYLTTDDETAAEFVKIVTQANIPMKPIEKNTSTSKPIENVRIVLEGTKGFAKSWTQLLRESRVEFVKYLGEVPREVERLRKLRNRCLCELLIIFILCGCGAFVFKTTEGTFETFYKCGVKRVKRDFIDDLWRTSHFMKEDEWKSKARRRLWEFENQLHEAFDAGMTSYSGQKSWSFVNALVYCLTVLTTIGYGHLAPVTTSGRALTIAYSIIGIPLFLILLADFGKLFTRGIKFLWVFVRRLYYTGSCRNVRRTGPVQEVMKGMQMMYETIRRPSMFPQDGGVGATEGEPAGGTPGDPPSTPALSTFAIDDEFNLPISVAITILLFYIFMGATVFWFWEEDWSFFESFYFVFISMSTIGFGDLVPKNQMYMMASIVYLAFGLALTSMCINVVQEKLSDSFRKASAKIGATIGLKVSEDDGTISPVSPTHVEIAEVHKASVLSLPQKVP